MQKKAKVNPESGAIMENDEHIEPEGYLYPISQDEIIMAKKVLLSRGKLDKQYRVTSFPFKTAKVIGQQFVISVPRTLVEDIKRNYEEALRTQDSTENEEDEKQ